ncbi:MAG: sigma-70 family RNA polymerase sigma factor [Acidobacteriaceae bacterium]|nr:sigma-70 family RNA polymerase sigma factor [Acidobacteriaceae bacterium]
MNSPKIRVPASEESFHEDEALIRRCLAGDENAWSQLIKKYANLIFSIPIKRGLSQEDAADVFQTVCAALFASLANLREPRALAAWLIQTTARACERSQFHTQKWTSIESEQEADIDSRHVPDELIAQLEREQAVRETVNALSAECRKLIHLLFYSDPPIPYERAAAELGLAKGSMGATRMRCLEKLRKSLDERGFS